MGPQTLEGQQRMTDSTFPSDHLPQHVRDSAVAALCDALNDQYDDMHFFPVVVGEPLPPGARVLPAAPPVDSEPGFDVGVGAAGNGGRDRD
jgi:hypothetical protein